MYTSDPKSFTEIEHTADIGLTITGKSLPELFANAAFGMYHLLLGEQKAQPGNAHTIKLEGSDLAELFVAWLSELNYLFLTQQFIAGEIRHIHINESSRSFSLETLVYGEKINLKTIDLYTEIKAVTYHHLMITRDQDRYKAQVIFDI